MKEARSTFIYIYLEERASVMTSVMIIIQPIPILQLSVHIIA